MGCFLALSLGYILMLVAMTAGGAAAVYIRKYLNEYNSFDVASIRMFVAAVVVMPLSALTIGFDLHSVTSGGYVALLYAALVGTFAGHCRRDDGLYRADFCRIRRRIAAG